MDRSSYDRFSGEGLDDDDSDSADEFESRRGTRCAHGILWPHECRTCQAEIDPVRAQIAEQEIHVENMTGEPARYHVLGPAEESSPLDELEAEQAEKEASGPLFGERLRRWIQQNQEDLSTASMLDAAYDIADAIDQDALSERQQALALHADAQARVKANLRRQVGEAVERQRYAASHGGAADGASDFGEGLVDVLDVEPFLAEVEGIFGARSEPMAKVPQPSLRDLLPPRCSSVSWRFEQCALPQGHKGPHHNESISAIWAACGGTERGKP